GARAGRLYAVEPDGFLRELAYDTTGPTKLRDQRLPPGAGVIGRAVAERRPVATLNLLTDPAITLPPEIVAQIPPNAHLACLGAAATRLYTVDAMSGDLVERALRSTHPQRVAELQRMPAGAGIMGWAIRERQTVCTSDVMTDQSIWYPPRLREMGAAIPNPYL